jgi:release factor glutamine methyltransferase
MQKSIIYIQTELKGLYPDSEIRSFTNLMLEKISGFNRTELIVNKNTIFSGEQVLLIQSFVEKLKIYTPIQYILGETEFYGLNFTVNSAALIPRPETEELVEWIQQSMDSTKPYSILDIGTGSGCIALSIKSIFPKAQVSGIDISEKALELARLNANQLKMEIDFFKHDILTSDLKPKVWDIIVSNPPYIPQREKTEISPNVLDYEPHLALFVADDNPLLFYRAIAEQALKALKIGGKLFFEIHRSYGQACVEMLEQKGFTQVELKKDLSGNDRMIKAKFNLNSQKNKMN